MSSTPTNPNGPLTYVTDLIPPNLLQALEIDTTANLIAIYWEPAGDEATWYDGQIGADCNWWAYQTYFDHPAIILALAAAGLTRAALGSSDTRPTHWAIIDRAQNRLYIAPTADAERIISAQWPQPTPDEITQTQTLLAQIDWPAFRRSLAQILANQPAPTPAQREQHCRQLETWLDQHLAPDIPWTYTAAETVQPDPWFLMADFDPLTPEEATP